jgi:hypothetical protein
MTNVSHIHVRPLEIADFDFVRGLAATQPNFTVPATYVLWLLLRIKGAVCLVAEKTDMGPCGYLLAVPIVSAEESLFVGQLAALDSGPEDQGTLLLLSALRDIARKGAVRTIGFSVRPDSAAHRLISKYSDRLVAKEPQFTAPVPPNVASNESEYRIDLTTKH